MKRRLAVVTTHPIQYYAPWFSRLHRAPGLELRVFYLWDFGVTTRVDPTFGHTVRWDIPLLDGYMSEFVPNTSRRPGTDHIFGLWNPSLAARVRAFGPTAVLLLTYNFAAIYRLLAEWRASDAPLLFRGDSHRLVPASGSVARLRRSFISHLFRRFRRVPVRWCVEPTLLRGSRRPRVKALPLSTRSRQRSFHQRVRRSAGTPCGGEPRSGSRPDTGL